MIGFVSKLFALTMLFKSMAFAAPVSSLFIWQPLESGPKFILPQIEGMSNRQVVSRYVQNYNTSDVYQNLTPGFQMSPQGKITLFASSKNKRRPRIALIANRGGHMRPDDPFLTPVMNSFREFGADIYLIPLGVDLVVGENGLNEYIQQIIKYFPGLIAAGGYDVHHAHYEGSRFDPPSVDDESFPNYHRDRIEIFYIQQYTNARRGFFLGICRGHQLWAVMNGHALQTHPTGKYNKDMPLNLSARDALPQPVDVSVSVMAIVIKSVQQNLLHAAFGPHVENYPMTVRHNHSVVLRAEQSPRFRVVAVDGDDTIEAAQSDDLFVATLQGHIEDRRTSFDDSLLAWIVSRIRQIASQQELQQSGESNISENCNETLGGS